MPGIPMAARVISQAAIAQAARVSRMTVSLALRNHPSLPAATCERIRVLAAKLGYRPDPELARLMDRVRERKQAHGRSGRPARSVLAYLTSHAQRQGWSDDPTQRGYHDGAVERARDCGYAVQDIWVREPGMTPARLAGTIRRRGIDGILVAPLPAPGGGFPDPGWDGLSVVALGYSLAVPDLNRACNHQFQSMTCLVRALQRAGYRDIGLAMPQAQDARVNHIWRSAYLGSRHLAEEAGGITPLLPADWSRDVFARWLDRHHPAVVVTVGPEVQEWLDQLGIRTPGDIGLANLDLQPSMRGVTGIDQHPLQVGAAAVDLLIAQVRSGQRGIPPVARVIMVEGSLVQGVSTWERVPGRV